MAPRERILLLCLGAGLAPARAAAQGAGCAKLKAACRIAGFVPGGSKSGNGLIVDCFEPILEGRGAVESRSGRALPQVDPDVVAACRKETGAVSEVPPAVPIPMVEPRLGPGPHPNIVFILTDDMSLDLVQYMPHLLDLQRRGLTFKNYFVTDSLCCPSRSSIFTGRFPHDTGVFKNEGPDGGYDTYIQKGNDRASFAVALANAAYRTAMMGKYLNGYLPAKHPPGVGWSEWDVAGNGYPEFNYNLNEDGRIRHYGSGESDYLTDVLGRLGAAFMRKSGGKPFLLEAATFAPHAPYIPAPRDLDAFPGLRAPRSPAFNAPVGKSGPNFLRNLPPLSPGEIGQIDKHYRMRAQSVLAVDKLLADLEDAVRTAGLESNTYFFFSSDNGYHMGEHRLHEGKMTAYDTDIHVPLIVAGPGVPPGRAAEEIVQNVDLCSTFSELAGAETPGQADGRSLVPLLKGEPPGDWRTATLIEHHGGPMARTDPDAPPRFAGLPPTYEALRTADELYVEYSDGEREYHDLSTDPSELENAYASLPPARRTAFAAALAAMENCHDDVTCRAAQRPDLGRRYHP